MGQTDATLRNRVVAHFAESANLKLASSQFLAGPIARCLCDAINLQLFGEKS